MGEEFSFSDGPRQRKMYYFRVCIYVQYNAIHSNALDQTTIAFASKPASLPSHMIAFQFPLKRAEFACRRFDPFHSWPVECALPLKRGVVVITGTDPGQMEACITRSAQISLMH
jgi:hypothetical protein